MKRTHIHKNLPFKIKDRELIGKKDLIYDKHINIGNKILWKLKHKLDFVGQVDAATGKINTFGRMRERSVRCALWLQTLGIKSGDVITVCTHNHLETYIPYLAALYIGAIINPWPKQEKAIRSNAEHFLTRVTPKVIFVDYDNAKMIRAAVIRMCVSTKIVVFGDAFDEFESLELILSSKQFKAVDIDAFSCALKSIKDPAIILLSCGTTGFLRDVEVPYMIFLAPSNRQIPIMRSGDVGLWFESLCWIISLILTVRAILEYVKVIKSSGFDEEHQLCQIIQKYEVTWMFLETSMCNRLSKFDIFKEYNTSSLKQVIFGGSTIKRNVHKDLIQSLPNASIVQVYCLPETGVIAYQRKTGRIGSSGYVGKNIRLLIVDFATKEPLGPHTTGVIWCQSSSMMNGYYKDSRSTRNVIDDNGWFRSEDVGYYDKQGNIFVIDRVTQLIKYRHHYISPAEIEIELKKYPKISEVVVVPLPDDYDDFLPMAFITLVPGLEALRKKELLEFISKNFDDWKQPHGGIRIIEQMPRMDDGTIDRKVFSCLINNLVEIEDFIKNSNKDTTRF